MARQPTRYDLNGLVAVVTGGGQNIGKEIARALVRSGASVVIVDWNGATASATARELQVHGDACTQPVSHHPEGLQMLHVTRACMACVLIEVLSLPSALFHVLAMLRHQSLQVYPTPNFTSIPPELCHLRSM